MSKVEPGNCTRCFMELPDCGYACMKEKETMTDAELSDIAREISLKPLPNSSEACLNEVKQLRMTVAELSTQLRDAMIDCNSYKTRLEIANKQVKAKAWFDRQEPDTQERIREYVEFVAHDEGW